MLAGSVTSRVFARPALPSDMQDGGLALAESLDGNVFDQQPEDALLVSFVFVEGAPHRRGSPGRAPPPGLAALA